jgi:dihydrofolate reductase
MSKLRVHGFSISVDGYGAGPVQDLANPLGIGGTKLHEWIFPTRTFQRMQGNGSGETGVDDDFLAAGFDRIGAWILGRNMFGPVRGPWPDQSWRGWWGEDPPCHVPVFVLTHHERAPVRMAGGTEFHFVTGGVEEALQKAKDAAGELDVRLGGGVATLRQYLRARLVDEMHVAIAPLLLGSGEHLFVQLDLPTLGYECAQVVPGQRVTHVVVKRREEKGEEA